MEYLNISETEFYLKSEGTNIRFKRVAALIEVSIREVDDVHDYILDSRIFFARTEFNCVSFSSTLRQSCFNVLNKISSTTLDSSNATYALAIQVTTEGNKPNRHRVTFACDSAISVEVHDERFSTARRHLAKMLDALPVRPNQQRNAARI